MGKNFVLPAENKFDPGPGKIPLAKEVLSHTEIWKSFFNL